MEVFAIQRNGKFLTWIWGQGIRHDGQVVEDFMQWSDDINRAKIWKTSKSPLNIADIHKGTLDVVSINMTRKLI